MFSNIQNAYVKYLNLTTERSGPLFQSRYRIRRIENEESFLHVSRYIHLNPTTSYLVKVEDLLFYQWSSLPCYLKDFKSDIVNTNLILKLIGGQDKYREFVYGQVDYQRKLDRIKHLVLE
jgi:putative transposase